MSECRECDRSIPDGSNFCPKCGGPQNELAAKALQSFTRERLAEMSPAEREELLVDETVHGGPSQLERRLSYAIGWITIVVGLAILPALASVFVLAAGVVVLPPIRRLLSRRLGRPLGRNAFVGLYGIAIAVGAGLFWLL